MSRIEVADLHFSYNPEEEILKGINLKFQGESTAIIGQNGAGKTTFVKLLKGLLKPSSGDVVIKGVNTKDATVAVLAKHIGLVFQNPNDQIFKSRVLDEIMFGPVNIGMDSSKAASNSMKALELVDLTEKLDENPYDLSLSERKLVSIASILAMEPDIVIFDEPTIAQDYPGREKIKSIVKSLKSEGRLVITITHDMDFVAETFDRVIVFQQGNVLLDGTPQEVYSNSDVLYNSYLEPPHVTQLCQKLGYKETFLTVDEFVEYKKSKAPSK
jgi:energy-coupling factor transport system ATP-binding protein